MTGNKDSEELGENENWKDNTAEINETDTTNSADEFDWDFLLDREWSRTKK